MRSVKTDVCNMGPCKRWREQGIRQARHSFHARNGTHNNIFLFFSPLQNGSGIKQVDLNWFCFRKQILHQHSRCDHMVPELNKSMSVLKSLEIKLLLRMCVCVHDFCEGLNLNYSTFKIYCSLYYVRKLIFKELL